MRRVVGLLMALAVFIWPGIAVVRAEEKPVLMLDTGGHQALIRGIIFTPDGKYLISAGDDKVVRVWDWRASKTMRTIRGQVGPGNDGKIYAMALSPDGRWLAVGGWLGSFTGTKDRVNEEAFQIRLYDFASGRLKALLKGHTDVIFSLAFSPDGKRLISGSADKTAILWDVERRALLHRLEGHRDFIFGVAFTPDGERAVTGSYDRTLRLWRVSDGSLVKEMQGHQDKVRSLAISSKDGWIASGDTLGEIRLWDGRTGEFLKTLVKQEGEVSSLAFSPDGGMLLSTSGYFGNWSRAQHVWNIETGKEIVTYTNHDNNVLASAFSPDGRSVVTGGGNQFPIHVWDPRTGKTKMVLEGTGRQTFAVGFSADGKSIAWGNTSSYQSNNERGPLQFSMHLPNAGEALAEPDRLAGQDGWVRATTTFAPWSLQRRQGGQYRYDAVLDILKDGKTQASIELGPTDGYQHRAYGFTPDGQSIVSGADNGSVAAYRLDGAKVGDFVGHEGDVWAVTPSPDGKYLVSGSADQTVRLWNLQTRELLVTLFRGDDGEWVMWTPEGFFTGSKKGAQLVGWQLNQGADKEARYVTADQLRKSFFRPDLVVEKIAGDANKVKAEADRLKIDEILASGIAPEVAIIDPAEGRQMDDVSVSITARVTDKGSGIGRITWRVNGQVVGSAFGAPALNNKGEITRGFELAAPENKIEVAAENKRGVVESLPAKISIKVDEKVLRGVPNLYVLAIGVDRYQDVKHQLKFAVSDAETLGEVMADAGTGYYRNKPVVKTLSDDEVTADRLSAIFTDLGEKIRANDVFVFFIAGHGKTINGDYYFAPRSIDTFDDNGILKQGFGPHQWAAWFENIKAQKSIWIFDTCESGSATKLFRGGAAEDETSYRRLRDATGRAIFMAASAQDQAAEGYHGHGVFTYAILEGLARAADITDDKVYLFNLADYVRTRVPEISREMKTCTVTNQQEYCQRPQIPLLSDNYPIMPRYSKIIQLLETPSAGVFPKEPTHVVIQDADVFLQAARGAGPTGSLKAGDQVTVVHGEGDWAQVAQRGRLLGFVEKNRLLKLNQ
jgi:WD40 repeat protein